MSNLTRRLAPKPGKALVLLTLCAAVSIAISNGPARGAAESPSRGGELVFEAIGGPDWIDPGQTWYTFGWMLSYAVNRPLYSYGVGHPLTALPDLAEGDPVISSDGRTVTVGIKSGVRYSPPVSREATSYDVKYAIERAFSENVSNGYVFTYFADIEGAPTTPGPIADIPGIETPDARTIVFHLTRPTAPTLVAALVLPITAPVPEEYAASFDAASPSEYDSHVAFTGPYMVRNDADGNLIFGDDLEIVRNPNWDPATDFRPAYLDGFRIRQGNDVATMAAETLDGSHLLCCDVGTPPGVEDALVQRPTQVGSEPGHGTRWVAFNTTVAPLTNLNIRKALSAALDRNALRDARGGPVAGEFAFTFLPPGVAGFEESGGASGFGVDYLANPLGDHALAKAYLLKARQQGLPVSADGKYKGPERLLIVGSDSEPGSSVARLVAKQVKSLGFKVHLRLVQNDVMYNEFCGRTGSEVAICPNVGWFMDFPDPQSLLEPTFSGSVLAYDHHNNWSQLDVAEINEAIDAADVVPPGPERSTAWAEINRKIVEQAPGVPYLWDTSYALSSSDVAGVMNPFYSTWDLSFTSIRQ